VGFRASGTFDLTCYDAAAEGRREGRPALRVCPDPRPDACLAGALRLTPAHQDGRFRPPFRGSLE